MTDRHRAMTIGGLPDLVVGAIAMTTDTDRAAMIARDLRATADQVGRDRVPAADRARLLAPCGRAWMNPNANT